MHLAIPTAFSTASHNHFSFSAWLHNLIARDVAPTSTRFTRPIATHEIARNKILDVKQPLGVTIECLDGSVWVTLDGDSRDVVLDAGQSFVVDRDQRTLLQALDAARVRLIEPALAQAAC
jgi:hypothetical protein